MFLNDMFLKYLSDSAKFREECIDCGNAEFHNNYELGLKVPIEWDLLRNLISAIETRKVVSVLVFYSDTPSYHNFHDLVRDEPHYKFCSYYELHCSIMNSTHDIRPQQRITSEIASASLVVVIDSNKCNDIVISAIRQFCNGSLILID